MLSGEEQRVGPGEVALLPPPGAGWAQCGLPCAPSMAFFFLIKIEVFLVSTAGCGAGK